MASTDELKGGVNLPLWVQISIVGLLSLTVIASGVIYYIKKSSRASYEDIIVKTEDVPDDYFKSFSEAPKEDIDPFKNIPKEPKPIVKPKPKPIVKPKPKPIVKNYFITEKEQKIASSNINLDLVKQRNLARGSTQVLLSEQRKGELEDSFSDVNYNPDYGLEKDIASQQNNLSRIITADRLFPALLINHISSDLAGQVTAQIEENIYGFHGRIALIPAGSKMIGSYATLEKVGMERIQINWFRAITPKGVNINLTDGEMTDTMGRSGLGGEIDRRYSEKYGMAFLITTLSTLGTYSLQIDNQAQQIAVQNLASENIALANKILEDQIDIKPRIIIEAGTRILINATRDIYVPEPINGYSKIKERT